MAKASALFGLVALAFAGSVVPASSNPQINSSDRGLFERSPNGCPPGTHLDKKTGACKK